MNELVFVAIIFFTLKVNIAWETAEANKNCLYQAGKKTLTFNNSIINIADQGKQLYISLCTESIKDKCQDDVSACLIDEMQPQKSIFNLGQYFLFAKDQNGNSILKSVNGQICEMARNKNYSLLVHLDCDDLLKDGPMFLSNQRCEYHIRMLHPACSPRCTTRVGRDNYLLDLQYLEDLGDIKVFHFNRTFYVSLCGPATNCGNSYPEKMACEIQNNTIHGIATLETQHVNYNENKGVLSVRGRIGDNSNKKYTELILKCSWEKVNVKATFKNVYQGNKYTFELESRHFCLKLPPKCSVTNRQYFYNISSLNKNRDHWLVSGLSTNSIHINVCGPLQNNFGKCKEQEAQVCLYQKGTNAINLGSVATNLIVTDNNSIKITYTGGSTCNANQTYKTEIEFICSGSEYGPKIISARECVYSFLWNTPAACPSHMVEGEHNCNLVEENGYHRNISDVHTSEDRIVQITIGINFRFNLCGPLVTPCAAVNDKVSACLERNGKEYIIGWSNKKLTNLNGRLFLELEDKIKNRIHKVDSSTIVFFHCNYTASKKGDALLNYTSDLKSFILNIYTPLACVPEKAVDCTVRTKDFVFDLSTLSSNRSNYIVSNGDEDYILNVCRSVINTGTELCPIDSPVCLKKKFEPNLINRYRRFGSVARPEWTNNELVLKYKNGGYCRSSTMFETSSTIHFRCSAQEKQPAILKKDYCSVEFIWFTRHACQISCSKCQFNTSTSVIDLSFMKNEIFELVKERNSFYFNLCSQNYTFCKKNKNDTCSIVESTPTVVSKHKSSYLVYKIANKETTIEEIWFELVCEMKINSFLIMDKAVINNTCYVALKTNKFCQNGYLKSAKASLEPPENEKDYRLKEYNAALIKMNNVTILTDLKKKDINNFKSKSRPNSSSTNTLSLNINDSNAKLLQNKLDSTRCIIRSPNTLKELSLTSLSSWNVFGKTTNYSVSFGSLSSACNGYICKNKTALTLPSKSCPEIVFGPSSVSLRYTQFKNCNNKNDHSSILLKCSNNGGEVPFVSQEDDCSVEIVYPTKEACKLFDSISANKLSLGIIFGIIACLVSSILIVVIGAYLYRKFTARHNYNSLHKNDVHFLVKVKEI